MLPMKLYESLPYAYIAAGVIVLFANNSVMAVSCSLLLILAGAVVWILRSDNRRSDIRGARYKYGGNMPFWWYEMTPFACVMLAMLMFAVSDNMYVYPFAVLLLGTGTHMWLLRSSYRKHQRPQVKLQPLRFSR